MNYKSYIIMIYLNYVYFMNLDIYKNMLLHFYLSNSFLIKFCLYYILKKVKCFIF